MRSPVSESGGTPSGWSRCTCSAPGHGAAAEGSRRAAVEGAGTAREYMVRAVPPALSAERDPRREHALPRRGGGHYDAKWGIDFGEVGREQVLAKVRKALGGEPARFDRSLEIGAGTGYFTLNLLRAGVIGEATCTDISPGMLDALARERRAARAGRARRAPPTPSGCRSRTAASTSCSATRCCTTSPTWRARSPSSSACSRRAARSLFAGEPSRYGDRLASVPKRAATALAPLWRRGDGAPRRRRPRDGGDGDAARSSGVVDVHAFAPGELASARARAPGFEDVRVTRRGAARELVRLDEPHARGDGRPRRGAVGLAPVRLPRLPRAAGARPPAARGAAAGGDLLQPDAHRAQAGGAQGACSGGRPLLDSGA